MTSKIGNEVSSLIDQLRLLQDEADAVATRQLNLRDKLKGAELKALELHQKIVEELCDVGGEG